MIDNIQAITASHLRADAKAEKKKSMLSRLAPEAAGMFVLLSAEDWNDSRPKMNRFVKDLVSDRDSQRARGIMQTKTKKWAGEISEKGLIALSLVPGMGLPTSKFLPAASQYSCFAPSPPIHIPAEPTDDNK